MVLLLNLIVPAVCMGLAWLFWKTRKLRYIFGIVLFVFIYAKVQPSYMPKGDIRRSDVPAFSAKPGAEIEDRNRKPVPSEERNAQQQEAYRKGLPFIESSK